MLYLSVWTPCLFRFFGSISVSRHFFSFPISSGSILPETICIVFHRPVRIWFIIKKMRVSFHLGNRWKPALTYQFTCQTLILSWTFISFSNALFTTVWCELISVSPLPSDRLLPVIYYLPDAPSIKPDIHNSSIFNKWPFRVLTYLISNCMCCTLRYLWSIIVL